MENERQFAVLIDADNVSDKYIKFILDEIQNDGVAAYKRIYGDWTNPRLSSWKNVLLECSVTPIQQYSYTTGKNATDSAMIIDAMDILYGSSVDGFCLVSSDSDFTRLAVRLREAGKYVVGMGEKKTPKAFIVACDKFTYLEVLGTPVADETKKEASSENGVQSAVMNTKELKQVVTAIVNELSDDEGWAHLGQVGTTLLKRSPDFDVRNYGFQKLTPLIKSLGIFEIKVQKQHATTAKLVYVRLKQAHS